MTTCWRSGTGLATFCVSLLLVAGLVSQVQAQGIRRAGVPPAKEQKDKPADSGKLEDYEPQFPKGMTWNLSNLNGKAPPVEATLIIDENLRGTGTSGCNTFSAALYPVKGQHLAMGPVAQTKKACPNDVMAFERSYLTILHSGPTWNLVGSTLTIKSQAGELTFSRGL